MTFIFSWQYSDMNSQAGRYSVPPGSLLRVPSSWHSAEIRDRISELGARSKQPLKIGMRAKRSEGEVIEYRFYVATS